jgi:hypothetical protein
MSDSDTWFIEGMEGGKKFFNRGEFEHSQARVLYDFYVSQASYARLTGAACKVVLDYKKNLNNTSKQLKKFGLGDNQVNAIAEGLECYLEAMYVLENPEDYLKKQISHQINVDSSRAHYNAKDLEEHISTYVWSEALSEENKDKILDAIYEEAEIIRVFHNKWEYNSVITMNLKSIYKHCVESINGKPRFEYAEKYLRTQIGMDKKSETDLFLQEISNATDTINAITR